jgi:hypothetical protein
MAHWGSSIAEAWMVAMIFCVAAGDSGVLWLTVDRLPAIRRHDFQKYSYSTEGPILLGKGPFLYKVDLLENRSYAHIN